MWLGLALRCYGSRQEARAVFIRVKRVNGNNYVYLVAREERDFSARRTVLRAVEAPVR